jgi:hypothetical protein
VSSAVECVLDADPDCTADDWAIEGISEALVLLSKEYELPSASVCAFAFVKTCPPTLS